MWICVWEGKLDNLEIHIIIQAAIHYHLPYSSLYGRINRLKREQTGEWSQFRDFEDPDLEDNESSNGGMEFKWVKKL